MLDGYLNDFEIYTCIYRYLWIYIIIYKRKKYVDLILDNYVEFRNSFSTNRTKLKLWIQLLKKRVPIYISLSIIIFFNQTIIYKLLEV
jgi:hypothetical protein